MESEIFHRVVFRSCLFTDNTAQGNHTTQAALDVEYAHTEIEDCTFADNPAYQTLVAAECPDVTISGCTFALNECHPLSGALVLLPYDRPMDILIENTIVAFTAGGCGVVIGNSAPSILTVRCCDIYGNYFGDWADEIADQVNQNDNLWGDPGFCDPQSGDYSIYATSPCAPDDYLGCGLVGAHGVGCEGDVIAVTAEGDGDFPTIQDALDSETCENWDVIELADGIYDGTGNRGIDFGGKAVTIRSQSNDASRCLIDCSGEDRAFSFSHYEGQASVLRGLAITNGMADYGGGIWCFGTSPRVERCLLYRNEAQTGGGAVGCDSHYGLGPFLLGCTLSGNSAPDGGGIYCADSAWPVLKSTIICFSEGGEAVSCPAEGSPTLHCCDLFDNDGGNWTGCIADQRGQGNVSIQPCFCDPDIDDYFLHADSWCATNELCGLVGALPVYCEDGGGVCMEDVSDPGDAAGSLPVVRPAPNPHAGSGNFTCSLGGILPGERVALSVYDIGGRFLRTIVDGSWPAGLSCVAWDGLDRSGRPVAPGVYFYRLRVGEQEVREPFVVVR